MIDCNFMGMVVSAVFGKINNIPLCPSLDEKDPKNNNNLLTL